MTGFGGFNRPLVAGQPTHRVAALWSGNTSTVGTTPNRATSTPTAPSLTQATAADRPLLDVTGSTPILHFDGNGHDIKCGAAAALTTIRECLWIGMHYRTFAPITAGSTRSIWSEWGTTERFMLLTSSTTVVVYVATSSIAYSSITFPVPLATQLAGMWLEVVFDGRSADPAKRVRLFVDSVEVASSASSGTMPALLLAGNATSNWLGSNNGSSNQLFQLAHLHLARGIPTATERAALRDFEKPVWDSLSTPSALSILTGWLQVANATYDVNGISSLPDSLNPGAPAVQATQAKRPLLELSANSLPCMRFASASAKELAWPFATAINGHTTNWGVAFWVKPDSVATSFQDLFTCSPAAGANIHRNNLRLQGNQLFGDVWDTAGTSGNGRLGYTAALMQAAWQFVTMEYTAGGAAEASKLWLSIDGVTRALTFGNQGTGAAMGTLSTPTASSWKLGRTFSGLIGPHVYTFSGQMSGASDGVLTPTKRFQLMAKDAPT
jgi:hypothetical protein